MRSNTPHLVRILFALALALAAPALAPTSAAAQSRTRPDSETLQMEVGDQVTIPGSDVASYSEGTEGVVSVRYDERSMNFVIVAQRSGSTSLLLIYNDGHQVRYRITVLGDEEIVVAGGVPIRENVRIDVYFVELHQDYRHAIGIGWPPSYGGGELSPSVTYSNTTTNRTDMGMTLTTLTDTLSTTLAGTINQALPRLDLSQAAGWTRILRHAMVVTANGEEASIDTGGEQNFRVVGGLAAEIRTVRFGSIVTMTPRYDSTTRRIEIHVNADISELTPPVDANIPGRTRTVVDSTVNLELGQSIVLGGLVGATARESQGGLPGLSQIPILGVLFGTNNRSEERVENFVFIVPTVVQAVPRADADRIAEALRVYQDFGSIGGHGLDDIELIEPSPPGYE